jgi:hypothetical protein
VENITIDELEAMSSLELRCYRSIITVEIERNVSMCSLLLKRIGLLERVLEEIVKISERKRSIVEYEPLVSGENLLIEEMNHVLKVMKNCNWSRTESAKRLDITRRALVRRIDKFRKLGAIIPKSLTDFRKTREVINE